jgi:methyl-accepting chemotaxis protein
MHPQSIRAGIVLGSKLKISIAMPRWGRKVLEETTIRQRFRILIAMALGFGLIFGASVLIGMAQEETALRDQAAFAKIDRIAKDIQSHSLIMESASNTYLNESNRDAVKLFHDAEATGEDDIKHIAELEQALPLLDINNDVASKLNAINALFVKTEQLAEKLGLHDNEGLKGKLQNAAHAIDEELEVHQGVDVLVSRFALVRLAERDFILFHEKSALARFARWSNEMDFKIDSVTALDPAVRATLSKNLETYTTQMDSYSATSLELVKTVDQLRSAFHGLQVPLAKMTEEARMGMEMADNAKDAIRMHVLISILVIGLGASALFLPVSILFQRSITEPLFHVEQAMKVLAAGDHSIQIPATERKDEVGNMARALSVFKDNALTMDRLRSEEEAQSRRRIAKAEAMDRMTREFDDQVRSIIEDVAQASSNLHSAATRIRGSMTVTSEAINDVNFATQEASQGVQMMASASEELAASSGEIAGRIVETADIASRAADAANRADTLISSLSESSKQIGDVVGLITTIANQTNLLALNATIEASRAGEAGKGFAVVAQEVKILATKTADATYEVSRHVAAVQSATMNAVVSISEISGTIANLNTITSAIASAVEEQSITTREIAHSAASTAKGTDTVAKRIGEVSQQAHDVESQSELMLEVVTHTADRTNTLRNTVTRFLEGVRKE